MKKILIFVMLSLATQTAYSIDPVNCASLLDKIVNSEQSLKRERLLQDLYTKYYDLFYDESVKKPISNSYGPLPSAELLDVSNKLIDAMAEELKSVGVVARVVEESIEGAKKGSTVTFNVIKLDLKDSVTTQHNLEMMGRLQKRYGVVEIVVDPITPYNESYNALYLDKVVTINASLFLRNLFEDRVGRSLTHEFTHARFSYRRGQGIASPFDPAFHGNLKRFTHVETEAYADVFAYEEIYNYGRELHNAAREYDRELTKETLATLDLEDIEDALMGIHGVSYQGSILPRANMMILDSLGDEDHLLYGKLLYDDDDTFGKGRGFVLQFDDYAGSFFLDASTKKLYTKYVKNCLTIEDYIYKKKIKGGWKVMTTGDLKKFFEQPITASVKPLYDEALQIQRQLFSKIHANEYRVAKLSSEIHQQIEELLPAFKKLQIRFNHLTDGRLYSDQVLVQFNKDYQALRLEFRKISLMVMDADKTP